jgi:protein TIF31
LSQENAQIIEEACKHVASWKSTEFDIRFNPNLYQPHVKLGESETAEQLKKDKQLLLEAAQFLLNTQLPAFLKDLQEHNLFICDGKTLSEMMHARGINMRYLGKILKQLQELQLQESTSGESSVDYIFSIVLNELVSRCSKRVFRQYIQNVSNLNLSNALAHYLNCYLSNHVSNNNAANNADQDKNSKKKKSQKNKNTKNSSLGK